MQRVIAESWQIRIRMRPRQQMTNELNITCGLKEVKLQIRSAMVDLTNITRIRNLYWRGDIFMRVCYEGVTQDSGVAEILSRWYRYLPRQRYPTTLYFSGQFPDTLAAALRLLNLHIPNIYC